MKVGEVRAIVFITQYIEIRGKELGHFYADYKEIIVLIWYLYSLSFFSNSSMKYLLSCLKDYMSHVIYIPKCPRVLLNLFS